MKTGKTDVLNMIPTMKKTDLRTSANALQASFRDKLSRQTEDAFPSYSQNKKYEDKVKVSEPHSMKKNFTLKKNLKMEPQKKYHAEIKSYENLEGSKMKDFSTVEDKPVTIPTDKDIFSKEDEIDMGFDSDALRQPEKTEDEVVSDNHLLSSSVYPIALLVSSEPKVKIGENDLMDVNPITTETFSKSKEPILTIAVTDNEVQEDENYSEEQNVWNEFEALSHNFVSEKPTEKNESVKSASFNSNVSFFNMNLNPKQIPTTDEIKEDEVVPNIYSQEIENENQFLNMTETEESSFLSSSFNESSKRENKAETLIETEKTTQPLHRENISIKEHTFEEVIESKLKPQMDSGKIMLDDIRYQINQSKKQMKIQLKPKELGEMTLDLQVFKGGIVAKIFVDNEKAKVMIEQNLAQLKEAFKISGTEIKTVEVFVGNNANFQMNQQNMAQSQSFGHSMNFHKNTNGYMEIPIMEEEFEQEAVNTEGFDVLA